MEPGGFSVQLVVPLVDAENGKNAKSSKSPTVLGLPILRNMCQCVSAMSVALEV